MPKKMTPDEIIKEMASRPQGYTHHVFQYYGPRDQEKFGYSQSFTSENLAVHYADKVPGGIVYANDGHVTLGKDYYPED